jgi:hypothetical protein
VKLCEKTLKSIKKGWEHQIACIKKYDIIHYKVHVYILHVSTVDSKLLGLWSGRGDTPLLLHHPARAEHLGKLRIKPIDEFPFTGVRREISALIIVHHHRRRASCKT